MDFKVWMIWIFFAAIFIIGEIFTAGFFLFWFGIGALAAALLAALGLGPVWQWGTFVILSAVLFATSRKLGDRVTKKQPPGIGADRFIDKFCNVLEDIDNDANKGFVRMDKEEWRAVSETGEKIAKGTKVKVVSIDGTHLVVKQLKEGE